MSLVPVAVFLTRRLLHTVFKRKKVGHKKTLKVGVETVMKSVLMLFLLSLWTFPYLLFSLILFPLTSLLKGRAFMKVEKL